MKTRSEITFEIEETVTVCEDLPITQFCDGCSREVSMSTAHTAAMLSGTTEREIFRLLESNLLHFTENGYVLICLESLKDLGKEVV